ncbi:MAG: M23 family metallopeptidase [Bacilli bacterium]|nr:M23 family metallopeptidase [Bacilli bacterium]
MAIDPATAKLIAKVALKTLTDEDKRRNLIIGIVIAIVIFLMIILIPLFILLSPIEALKAYFSADENGDIKDTSYIAMTDIKDNYKTQNSKVGELKYDGGTFPLPVNNPTITCKFGARIHPVTGKQSFHTGLDIAGAWHSDIMSVEKGIVVFAGVQKAYGNCVEIEHKNNDGKRYFTFYAHLARIDVIKGQEVTQGSVIGIQGGDPKRDPNPGYSTGSHLHFEIRMSVSGDYLDPKDYLFDNKNV